MKKIIFIILFAPLCAFILQAEPPWVSDIYKSPVGEYAEKPKKEVKEIIAGKEETKEIGVFEDLNVYYFDGFDFSEKNTAATPLAEKNAEAIEAIIYGRVGTDSKVTYPNWNPYSIIGYSQGGLRALGYLKQIEKEANDTSLFDQIDAIVTVSSPVLGIKILEGDIKAKGHKIINKIARGIGAGIDVFNFEGVIPGIDTWLAPQLLLHSGFEIFMALSPNIIASFWKEIWQDPNLSNVPEIRDMKPGSGFIRRNVVQTEQIKYSRVDGEKRVLKWVTEKNNRGKNVKRLRLVKEEVLKWYTAIESTPQFTPDVPLGFIVGLNNNTLGMAGSETEKKIEKWRKGLEIGFGIVEGIHILKCFTITGLLSGSPVFAYDADQARRLMRNFKTEIQDLIGSKESDGFVTRENQYIPSKFTDPRDGAERVHLNAVLLLDDYPEGYADKPDYNHNNIMEKEDVYSTAYDMILEGIEKRKKAGLRWVEEDEDEDG